MKTSRLLRACFVLTAIVAFAGIATAGENYALLVALGDYDVKDLRPLKYTRADDSIVVAFSGHGVQFRGEKKSYFCPSDAKLKRKASLIGFDEVFAALKDCDGTVRAN